MSIKTLKSMLTILLATHSGAKGMCIAALNAPYHYNGQVAFPVILILCDFAFAIKHREEPLDRMQVAILLTELVYVALLSFANFKSITLPIWLSGSILLANLLIRCYYIKNQSNAKSLQLIGFILLYILCPILSNAIQSSVIINQYIIGLVAAMLLILPHSSLILWLIMKTATPGVATDPAKQEAIPEWLNNKVQALKKEVNADSLSQY